ncbi:MAG: DUF4082 domain-containing protein [bacterium]|nr:DUF4082 domain-containing protein [bacterium]
MDQVIPPAEVNLRKTDPKLPRVVFHPYFKKIYLPFLAALVLAAGAGLGTFLIQRQQRLASQASGIKQVYSNVNLFETQSPLPNSITTADATPVVVGLKFSSNIAGRIVGIRFHKAGTDSGQHIGSLWTASGGQLASATFTSESDSGWQQVLFSTPVGIAANTIYVASVSMPAGHGTVKSFGTVDLISGPLTAPAGNNGVYVYQEAGSFPTVSVNLNYYVDVVFSSP